MLKCFHFILSINRIWIHPLCIYLMIYVYIMIQLYIGCSLRCIYTDCAQQRVHCNQTAGCTMRGIDIYIYIIIQPYIYIWHCPKKWMVRYKDRLGHWSIKPIRLPNIFHISPRLLILARSGSKGSVQKAWYSLSFLTNPQEPN